MTAHEVPVVSVCVQTYRHAVYISQCLDGILSQKTSFPFEIVLGEDESDDGTRDICIRYATQHPDRIRLFLRSRKDVIYIGGKPTGRFNFVENLKACRGKYIAVCEGDDYWTDQGKLQLQFETMERNPGTGICFHRVREENNFDPSLSKWLPEIGTDTTYTTDDYIRSNRTATCSMFFRRSMLEPIPDWFGEVPFGDLGITLLMLKRSDGKAIVLHPCMAVYRVHSGGTHGRLKRDLESLAVAYRQHLHFTRMIRDRFLKGPEHKKAIFDKLIETTGLLADVYRGLGNRSGIARAYAIRYFYRMARKFTVR